MKQEEIQQDSNSLFSASVIVPLQKRQTIAKKQEKEFSAQDKFEELGYQIVEQLSLITPLEVHPSKIYECIQTFFYQRKLPSVMDSQLNKKEMKEKADFIQSITSLFRKSLSNPRNKFTIVLPSGGIVYFFMEEVLDSPKLFVSTQNSQFAVSLQKDNIRFKQLRLKEFERESILIQGQQIRLFYGFFLNWVLNKKVGIDIYSNYLFDFAFKEPPLVMKHNELRKQYQHLCSKEQTCVGQKKSKLYIIRFQSFWYKDDLKNLEQHLKSLEIDVWRKNKQRISHDFEFKVLKYTLGLDQEYVEKTVKAAP